MNSLFAPEAATANATEAVQVAPLSGANCTTDQVDTSVHDCQQCGEPFTPRAGSGGKPQKFCSEECRRSYKPNAGQCEPTPSAQTTLPVVVQPPAQKSAPEVDFSWANDESVIIHDQPTTAVYLNPYNQVVIRQECWPDDDAYVRITKANIPALIDKLWDISGEGSSK